MSDETFDLSAVPTPKITLRLDGEEQAVAETIVENTPAATLELDSIEQVMAENSPLVDDSSLTDEEKAMVNDFSQSIDITDSAIVLQYGAGAQKKMADFAQVSLENVKTQDLGEAGNLISSVVAELKNFNVEDQKGILGFFKKGKNQLEMMRVRYDDAEANIDKIVNALQGHQMALMKDSATLDKMYDLNLTYFKELIMYILAGKKKLTEVRNGELKDLYEKAKATGRAEDAQAVRDLESQCDRFEKKLSDLDLTRTIAMQTAPQIRLVQNNAMTMVEKIQTTIVNTIPLWKSQMVIALGIANSTEALKAQTAVTDMTNALLQKNAEMLHTSSVQVARESERGVVDIETLKKTNEQLIKTFDEVMQIQEDGRKKRQEAEVEMRRMEEELRQKMLQIHS